MENLLVLSIGVLDGAGGRSVRMGHERAKAPAKLATSGSSSTQEHPYEHHRLSNQGVEMQAGHVHQLTVLNDLVP